MYEGGRCACMCMWLHTYVHAGMHFPLGSSQGLVCKLYSLINLKWWQSLPKKEMSAPAGPSPVQGLVVISASLSAMPRLWCSGTCWTWSSSQNSPHVFRQAAWAMAWLPCRLKGGLTGHLGKMGKYPFRTDCWQPVFCSPSNLDQTCWSFECRLHDLIFLAEILHANCIFKDVS